MLGGMKPPKLSRIRHSSLHPFVSSCLLVSIVFDIVEKLPAPPRLLVGDRVLNVDQERDYGGNGSAVNKIFAAAEEFHTSSSFYDWLYSEDNKASDGFGAGAAGRGVQEDKGDFYHDENYENYLGPSGPVVQDDEERVDDHATTRDTTARRSYRPDQTIIPLLYQGDKQGEEQVGEAEATASPELQDATLNTNQNYEEVGQSTNTDDEIIPDAPDVDSHRDLIDSSIGVRKLRTALDSDDAGDDPNRLQEHEIASLGDEQHEDHLAAAPDEPRRRGHDDHEVVPTAATSAASLLRDDVAPEDITVPELQELPVVHISKPRSLASLNLDLTTYSTPKTRTTSQEQAGLHGDPRSRKQTEKPGRSRSPSEDIEAQESVNAGSTTAPNTVVLPTSAAATAVSTGGATAAGVLPLGVAAGGAMAGPASTTSHQKIHYVQKQAGVAGGYQQVHLQSPQSQSGVIRVVHHRPSSGAAHDPAGYTIVKQQHGGPGAGGSFSQSPVYHQQVLVAQEQQKQDPSHHQTQTVYGGAPVAQPAYGRAAGIAAPTAQRQSAPHTKTTTSPPRPPDIVALGDSITEGFNIGFVTSPDLWVNKLGEKILLERGNSMTNDLDHGPPGKDNEEMKKKHSLQILNAGNSGAIATILTGNMPLSFMPGHARKVVLSSRSSTGVSPGRPNNSNYFQRELAADMQLQAKTPNENLLENYIIPAVLSPVDVATSSGSGATPSQKVELTTIFFGTNEVGGYRFNSVDAVNLFVNNMRQVLEKAVSFSKFVILIFPLVEHHASLRDVPALKSPPYFYKMYKEGVLAEILRLNEQGAANSNSLEQEPIGVVDLDDKSTSEFATSASAENYTKPDNDPARTSSTSTTPKFFTLKDPSGQYAFDRLHPDAEGHAVIADMVFLEYERLKMKNDNEDPNYGGGVAGGAAMGSSSENDFEFDEEEVREL
ncbi:unnamed protein product [Amoebophrya sp. A120]|nr:unnamed protein product [Amoebophrya sp. A120]|eukprot:GSA120T00022224001.1